MISVAALVDSPSARCLIEMDDRVRDLGRGAELSSLLKTRFDTRPLEQSLKVLHENGAGYAPFAQRGLPNRDLAKPMDRAFSRAPSVRVITYAP